MDRRKARSVQGQPDILAFTIPIRKYEQGVIVSEKRVLSLAIFVLSIPLGVPVLRAQVNDPAGAYHKQSAFDTPVDRWMSPSGRLAYRVAHGMARLKPRGNGGIRALDKQICPGYVDDCGSDLPSREDASGAQAETTIAMDPTGQHIVIGYNDDRGFNLDTVSISGFAYSDDGGRTFTDGGQLPVQFTGKLRDGTQLPQVFGDPDVKWVPGGNGCQFVYSSILLQGVGTPPNFTATLQTIAVHRSTDCGHTWQGPFEVPTASNPNGEVIRGTPVDASDKELIDVDPDTGRVMVTWSNFTDPNLVPFGIEISSSYSDDIMTGNPPTWSSRVILNQVGPPSTASVPRFAGNGSDNVYVAWEAFGNRGVDVYVAASPNNGHDFAPPVRINPAPFPEMDYVLGNDRSHNFPSLAVDNSPGPNRGNVYVVYCSNANGDGCDIVFQRSVDEAFSFSLPVYLNSNPGADRAQWFPYITVDSKTGRVSVIYYDQGIATSGDLTELTWTYSDDGGLTWSKPSPLSPRPFHAGYGNDVSQPNLGDYIGSFARAGTLYAAYATTPAQAKYTDGEAADPDGFAFPYPNVIVQKGVSSQLALSLGAVTFTESGGNGIIDAGDTVRLRLPLRSYATNLAMRPLTFTGITGTLSTSTPGVTVTKATASYGSVAPGAAATNTDDFVIQVAPSFIPGTKIEFSLAVSSPQGTVTLPFTQNTGTPVTTQIFAENFDSTPLGSLPPGWTPAHGLPTPPQGVNPPPRGYVVPWTTNNSFCGTTSNGLFHVNANDGPALRVVNNGRWERAYTPKIVVPPNAEYVTLDFDICYDTEDDPEFPVTDYDGVFLRITDMTDGRTLRSVHAEAFAESIQTGNIVHFPKHMPRSSNPAYFEDMSNWGGFSNGFKHVSMRLPGIAGSTVQLRWEFTQDEIDTCADVRFGHSCGVLIDNIVMNSVVSKSDELKSVTLNPVAGSANTFTGTVELQPIAPEGGVVVKLTSNMAGKVTLPDSVTIPAGSTVSAAFTVKVDPSVHGTVTITATGPSNVRTADIKIP